MKKTSILVLALLAMLSYSCTMGEHLTEDIVGGRSTYYNDNGRKYMMNIADNLVTDMLDELELALDVNRRGVQTSAHFIINGTLTTVGATWIVKADDSRLKGMTLHCTAGDTWVLEYKGSYAFDIYNIYPTGISLSAQKLDGTADIPAGAEGWRVYLEGDREEYGGYRCTFETFSLAGSPQYLDYINTRGAGANGWDRMLGNLFMTVYKAQDIVDACCLSFEGSPSQATFVRGL